ncbi:hydrogenase maturation protease [Rhodothermus profundi]|uniref:Hydrogenase maturation protease n=1 Tax=Rhodothermus profundi TaxID=633813 RepID=A0A1M6RJW7_9BACT|nr:hydrogenase maturation protease [Rhodothermus profundi]SHK32791.1 hydrogenase maturation protease [Rhodothermus profundi]
MNVVIGIGHPLRGDDAAGLEAVAQVRSRLPRNVRLCVLSDPLHLPDCWEGAHLAIVCDAICSGAPPGTLHRFEAHSSPLPASMRASVSSHSIGLAEVIELARQLGRLPQRLIIYGIEGQHFDMGAPLSPAVAAALPQAAEAILKELGHA